MKNLVFLLLFASISCNKIAILISVNHKDKDYSLLRSMPSEDWVNSVADDLNDKCFYYEPNDFDLIPEYHEGYNSYSAVFRVQYTDKDVEYFINELNYVAIDDQREFMKKQVLNNLKTA